MTTSTPRMRIIALAALATLATLSAMPTLAQDK